MPRLGAGKGKDHEGERNVRKDRHPGRKLQPEEGAKNTILGILHSFLEDEDGANLGSCGSVRGRGVISSALPV